uniref:Innexin n=1 Tax=Macrostomum lignano TaxID=282301 RepID=A0A1I8IP25_9PLAT
MNFDFLLKANQFRVTVGQHGSAEDFVDVLNYTITPAVLIFLASISASRQYLFTPIQCWSLLELDSQRMEYIENLCWVDNMYFWPLDDTLPKGNEKQREERTICEVLRVRCQFAKAASDGSLRSLGANKGRTAGRVRGAGVSQQTVDVAPSPRLSPPHLLHRLRTVGLGADDVACQLESPTAQQIARTGQAGAMIERRVGDSLVADLEGGAQQASVRRVNLSLERVCQRPDYYQWVPFVLALQALLFYLPRLAWLCLSDRIGAASLNDTMRFALAAATSLDQDRRHRLIAYLAEHIHKLMRHAQPLSRSRRCRLLTRRTGFALVSAYLLTKAMYICVSLGQLAKFTVQCVLPNNMLNEKIYIFLWFWVFALALLTAASCLSWAASSILPSSRRALLKKYLRAGGVPPQAGDRSTARRFLRHFLRHDGVFLLRMIGRCAGDLLAADVAREVWRRYRDGQATAAKSWDLRFSGGCPTATAASAAAPLTATMRLAQRQVSGGGAHQLEEDDNGNELGRDDDGNEST